MKSICHRLIIEVPVEEVYNAITTEEGLSGWWAPETSAKAEKDSIARFRFSPDYFKEMKIIELKSPELVKWYCLSGYPEWIGTTITFELQPYGNGTLVFFHHDVWKEYTQEFAACSYHWALFLRSLRLLCETGKGLPSPNQH